jgi:hypothetical protein
VLGRDAEWDAAASALGRAQVGQAPVDVRGRLLP